MTVRLRTITGELGEYRAGPPWTGFDLSPAGARLLGLDSGAAISVEEISARQPHDSRIEYANAIEATLRDGTPLVLTHGQHRASDDVLRMFTTVTEVRHDADGAPAGLDGRFVDITHHVDYSTDTGPDLGVGLVECGAHVVALVTGDLDVRHRTSLGEALRESLELGDPDADVYVDARHLRYCDARSVTMLRDTARRLGPRRKLVVLHPQRLVRRLIDLIEADEPQPALYLRDVPGLADRRA